MTVLIPACAVTARLEDEDVVDEAELAAAAFLARYRGRTLDAYRSDLRGFFQWGCDTRREYYRFAHIDGRITSNPAQYVRHPKIHPSEARGLDRGELGAFCSPPTASTGPTLRSPPSWD